MKIVVCVKHVPDTQSERRFEDGRLVRGEDDVLNELDENAIEAAVSLVEEYGGEVIALTVGPEDAEDAVMRALQMGADRGIVISDDALKGIDAPGTARVLAAAIRTLEADAPVDIILTGMSSLDAMTSLVPAALAAHTQRPLLSLAHRVEVQEQSVEIERSIDGYTDVLRAQMPLVLSVTDQLNEPRYPAFAAMKAARSKPLDVWSCDDLEGQLDTSSLVSSVEVIDAQPNERAGRGTIMTDSGDAGERLARYLLDEVK